MIDSLEEYQIKLIAEFMGTPFKLYKEDDFICTQGIQPQYASYNCELCVIGDEIYELSGMLWKSSWNWMMAVVEKIESLGYIVMIEKTTCAINVKKDSMVEPWYCDIDSDWEGGENKIDIVYKAVLKFITFWKKNKKQFKFYL